MAEKRIRIDMQDKSGASYKLSLEGNITRAKMLKVIEMMDLVNIEEPQEASLPNTTGSKIWHVVDKFFPLGGFTSTNILEKFEDEFNEPIKLSIISTYLARFSSKGRVNRTRTGRVWTYQAVKVPQTNPNLMR